MKKILRGIFTNPVSNWKLNKTTKVELEVYRDNNPEFAELRQSHIDVNNRVIAQFVVVVVFIYVALFVLIILI